MTNLDQDLSATRFVVVDVESAGGTTGEHRIIEVGMVVIENGVVVRRYSTLVNPHEDIPEFISTMTGITNDMVKGAPEDDEALAPIREELSNQAAVFVGHNVGFDWSCVSKSFIRNGYDVPDVQRLCTCKLARRMVTELKRHDLATVAAHCNVNIANRHRALGDAEATGEVLMTFVNNAINEHGASSLQDVVALQYVPRVVSKRENNQLTDLSKYLNELPAEPGVYYFYSARRKLLYVGKARNLAARVRSYFGASPLHGRSISKMVRYVKSVEWTTTGTELAALLLESRVIKTHQPSYNTLLREHTVPWFIAVSTDEFPRVDVVNFVDDDGATYYGPIRSRHIAEQLCTMLTTSLRLRTCTGVLKPHPEYRPCFDFHLQRCPAPCALLETAEEYAIRAEQARAFLGRLEGSALDRFRKLMEDASENQDYEIAAMYRDGIRAIERMLVHSDDLPLTLHELNVVAVMPAIHSAYTVEIFALHAGRLCLQTTVAASSEENLIAARIREAYDRPLTSEAYSKQELEDLRLITGWLYQHKKPGSTFVVNGQSQHVISEQLRTAIDNAVHS